MVEIPFSIRLDPDGLLRKQCPFCNEQFKIVPDDELHGVKSEYYCPSCGLRSHVNEQYTDEQVEQALVLAQNYMFEQVNNVFSKRKSSKHVKIDFKPLTKEDVGTIIETNDFEGTKILCCNTQIFLHWPKTRNVLYCHYCGEINQRL